MRTLESKRDTTQAVFCEAREAFARAGVKISETDDEHAGAPTQAEHPLTLAAGFSAGVAYLVNFSTHPGRNAGAIADEKSADAASDSGRADIWQRVT